MGGHLEREQKAAIGLGGGVLVVLGRSLGKESRLLRSLSSSSL